MTERHAELEGFIRVLVWCPECKRTKVEFIDPRVDNSIVRCKLCGGTYAIPRTHEGSREIQS